ncbi:MAG: tetratricopeptide repeat protein [Pseudomonadota bacterium]
MLTSLSFFKRMSSWILIASALLVAACDSVEERVEGHYESGLALIEQDQSDKAILEFRNALKLDDKHAASYFELGRIFEARGDVPSAFARYAKAAEYDPNLLAARVKLARIYLVAGETEKAATEVDASLKLDPNDVEVLAVSAQLAIQEEDFAAARTTLDRALVLAPGALNTLLVDISYTLETATPAAALAQTDAAIAMHPEALQLHIVKLGLVNSIGDQPAIGAQLTRLIELFPDELRFREVRAQWALQNQDTDIAQADLRALALAQPENTAWITDLIRLVRNDAGDDAALAEFDRMIGALPDPFNVQLLLAQYHVETGRRDVAVDFLRNLIGTAGENANTARIALARLLISEGQSTEAYALVDTVLAEDSRNTDGLLLQSRRLINEGQLDSAIQQIRKALNEAPDDVRLLLLAGQAQEFSGNIDLANDRFAKAVRSDDYRVDTVVRYVEFLTRAGRDPAAEIVLVEALTRTPDASRLYDLLGFMRIRLQNWPGAQDAARALQSLDPDRARQLQAAILIGQERFDEGADLLKDLPEDERRRAASMAALVQTYLRTNEMDKAIVFLDDVLAETPDNLQALGLRGNLHLLSEEFDAARANYEAVLEIDPRNGGAHSALSRLYAMQGDNAASEAQLVRGLEASPDNVTLLARLAQLREIQGDLQGAVGFYDRLYRLIPNSLAVANNLASLISEHQADDPAAMSRAVLISNRLRDSEIPHYRDTYGWIQHLRGNNEEALVHLEAAGKALPRNPWVHYHLGMVYAAMERPVDARKSLEATLGMTADIVFPPRETIQAALGQLP